MNQSEEVKETKIEDLIKFPVRYDENGGGYFWDADDNMIAQVRGFGRLQYVGKERSIENAEKLQDFIGRWIAETLNTRSQQGWIVIKDVSDLPKESGEYLFQRRKPDFRGVFAVYEIKIRTEPQPSNVIGGAKVGESEQGCYEVGQFIAWQPLPEAYKEGGE